MSTLARVPLHPLLLAAFAVLSVYAGNLAEVLPIDLGGAGGPLVRSIAGAAMVLGACALLFQGWSRGAIVATALVAAFALSGRMGVAFGVADDVQLVGWAMFIGGATVVAIRARGSLATVTATLNTFTALLVALTLLTIVPYESSRVVAGSQGDVALTEPIPVTRRPERDIYLIVLDRYGSHWSIEHRFGISGRALPDWLATQGFQIYPGARANYRATDFSLASLLSMRMLDEYTVTPGRDSGDRTYARSRLARPDAAAFLRDNGYTYYQLGSWYGPTQTNQLADVTLTWNQDTEFEAVLRESTVLPLLDRVLGHTTGEGDEYRDDARAAVGFQVRQIQRLASVPGRKFVFAHILLPHPPYVFDADGQVVVKRTAETVPERELYQDQLAYTDTLVRGTVDALLAGPDERDPIVVIMGDEGPFLCRNVDCVDDSARRLGIRFGTLAAYYLPGQAAGFFPDDHTHVNTFRGIFRAYFGADLPALPDRSYDWPDNDHIYDFVDVTDRLPLPFGVNGPEGLDLPPMEGPDSSPPPGNDLSLDGGE